MGCTTHPIGGVRARLFLAVAAASATAKATSLHGLSIARRLLRGFSAPYSSKEAARAHGWRIILRARLLPHLRKLHSVGAPLMQASLPAPVRQQSFYFL